MTTTQPHRVIRVGLRRSVPPRARWPLRQSQSQKIGAELDGGAGGCQRLRRVLQLLRRLPHHPGAPLLLSALSCVPAAASPAAGSPAGGSSPAPPLAPPGPGAAGCVESQELKAFVLALEAERGKARAQALAQLRLVEQRRRSQLAEPSLALGATYQREGQRLAVVAHLATAAPPLVPLVQRDRQLHALEERPRAHPIPLRVCGVRACAPPRSPSLPPLRAVAVALEPGEQLGAPVRLSYDYWWAQVSYDRVRHCAAPAAGVQPAGGAGKQ